LCPFHELFDSDRLSSSLQFQYYQSPKIPQDKDNQIVDCPTADKKTLYGQQRKDYFQRKSSRMQNRELSSYHLREGN